MISRPRLGRITQGTVFCGGIAEEYEGVPVWGVVITARCDTAHDKVPIVNYLPVVRVEDWLCRHGGALVLDRALNERRNRFKNLLTQRGLALSLLEVHSPMRIVEVHFAFDSSSPPSKKVEREAKDAKTAAELAAEIASISETLALGPTRSQDIGRHIRAQRKALYEVVRDLLGRDLAGYYYIPHLGADIEQVSELGYVVLLREVHHLPRRFVRLLIDGIAKGTLDAGESNSAICFDSFDFVYPIAEIQSPWVEHLMQAFCSLFARIGVADLDKNRITTIVDLLAPEIGGGK